MKEKELSPLKDLEDRMQRRFEEMEQKLTEQTKIIKNMKATNAYLHFGELTVPLRRYSAGESAD